MTQNNYSYQNNQYPYQNPSQPSQNHQKLAKNYQKQFNGFFIRLPACITFWIWFALVIITIVMRVWVWQGIISHPPTDFTVPANFSSLEPPFGYPIPSSQQLPTPAIEQWLNNVNGVSITYWVFLLLTVIMTFVNMFVAMVGAIKVSGWTKVDKIFNYALILYIIGIVIPIFHFFGAWIAQAKINEVYFSYNAQYQAAIAQNNPNGYQNPSPKA